MTSVAISSLTNVGGNLNMSLNGVAAAINAAAVNLRSLSTVGGTMTLTRAGASFNLNSLTSIIGALTVSTNCITSLSAPALVEVDGAIRITNNTSLTSISIPTTFTGGNSASLSVTGNTALVSANMGITGVTGNLTFNTNGTAVSTIDLNNLGSVGGNFIMNNAAASNCTPSIDIAVLTSVTGNMQFTRTAGSINALALTNVSGNFTMSNNATFANMDLSFPAFLTVGGNLSVTNNPLLATCCIIPCKLVVTGTTTVSGNTGNCLNLAVAQNSCEPNAFISGNTEVCLNDTTLYNGNPTGGNTPIV